LRLTAFCPPVGLLAQAGPRRADGLHRFGDRPVRGRIEPDRPPASSWAIGRFGGGSACTWLAFVIATLTALAEATPGRLVLVPGWPLSERPMPRRFNRAAAVYRGWRAITCETVPAG